MTDMFATEISDIREAQFNDETKTAVIRLFKPGSRGQGGKGAVYFPRELVNQATLDVFKGSKGYIDHPPPGKEKMERSLRDLAFVVTDVYPQNGQPIANVKFLSDEAFRIAKDAQQVIGLSIIGNGITKSEMAPDGKRALVAKGFLPGSRLDMVTDPGAGGAFTQIIEALREGGNEMEFENLTLEELQSNRADLVTQIREAAITEVNAAHAKQLDEVNGKLATAEQEVTTIRESLANSGDITDKVAELTGKIIELSEQAKARDAELAKANKQNLIATTIREANIPEEYVAGAADLLNVMPEDKWDAVLDPYKKLGSGTPKPGVQGNTDTTALREARKPASTTNAQGGAIKRFRGIDMDEIDATQSISMASSAPTRGPLARASA